MFEQERAAMVADQIMARGIQNKEIVAAMSRVPRHSFIREELWPVAYADHPVSIGFGQTISQPYIVASMLELARPSPEKRLLEVGSGCGYLLAIASNLFKEVVGIETISELCDQSRIALERLDIHNVHVFCGDGYEGVPDGGIFESIIISCAAPIIPPPLFDQLAPGGVLVAPIGDRLFQDLMVAQKDAEGNVTTVSHGGVRFVPLVSDHHPISPL